MNTATLTLAAIALLASLAACGPDQVIDETDLPQPQYTAHHLLDENGQPDPSARDWR